MRGIDYSPPGSTVNRDPDTGIRYGIISLHALHPDACEDFEAEYDARCPHCGEEVPDDTHFTRFQAPTYLTQNGVEKRPGEWTVCASCEKHFREDEQYDDEPDRQVLNMSTIVAVGATLGTYKGMLDSSLDAWCFKSPYYTRAAFCSPCAPGACSLSTPCEDGERAYCFGHDWFEGGTAPYPVYSVETGELVRSPDDVALQTADDAERREMEACAKLDETDKTK